ncbi:MAG: acyl carrier protein [Bacteroides sp.]|nr:acyl carrier protein [Bacteroides sp.]
MSTFEKVRDIISKTLNINPDTVTAFLAMDDIAEWDSMGNMAIIAALEENLGIEFPIEDLFELNSVPAIVAEIDRLSNK